MRDEEAVRRIRQGEKDLLDLLVDKYYQEIFRFCYYRTGNEQAAYDCVQETFLHMLRAVAGGVEIRSFQKYLMRVALNVCRDHYRKNPDSEVWTEEEPWEDRQCAGRGLPHRDMDGVLRPRGAETESGGKIEDAYVIQQCLMRLPDYQREAIILHFYYGYKAREIAAAAGVPLATAKSRLRQGLDRLKKIFREEGIYEA